MNAAATTSSIRFIGNWSKHSMMSAQAYVFCVNVDAVIAALLLALLWKDYQSGALSRRELENAAFTVFLYGRMIGAAAEIDDHLNLGRNMDTWNASIRLLACGLAVRSRNIIIFIETTTTGPVKRFTRLPKLALHR